MLTSIMNIYYLYAEKNGRNPTISSKLVSHPKSIFCLNQCPLKNTLVLAARRIACSVEVASLG